MKECAKCSKYVECPHCGCAHCLNENQDLEQSQEPCTEYDGEE